MNVSNDLSIWYGVVDQLDAEPGARERWRVEQHQKRAGDAKNDEVDESQKPEKRKRIHESLRHCDLEREKIGPVKPINEPLVELFEEIDYAYSFLGLSLCAFRHSLFAPSTFDRSRSDRQELPELRLFRPKQCSV